MWRGVEPGSPDLLRGQDTRARPAFAYFFSEASLLTVETATSFVQSFPLHSGVAFCVKCKVPPVSHGMTGPPAITNCAQNKPPTTLINNA